MKENIELIIQGQLINLNYERLFEYFCLDLQLNLNFEVRFNR